MVKILAERYAAVYWETIEQKQNSWLNLLIRHRACRDQRGLEYRT